MIDHGEKIEFSIRRALSLLERLSELKEDQWDISAYKNALLARMEIQYIMAVIRLKTNNSLRTTARSKINAHAAVQLLKSLLAAPISEKTLDSLSQVDLFLGRFILSMRRRLDRNQKYRI
ncbi:MAG: hypothetical protein H5T34_01985 [Candidatus Methanomethyliales bacterium]|nr:hypothetical protein [Candidatus Methanomethylicales archaeon]